MSPADTVPAVAEQFIGARRSRSPRARWLAVFLAAAAIVFAVTWTAVRRIATYSLPSADIPNASVEARTESHQTLLGFGPATLRHRGTVGLVTLLGAPHDRGYQLGRLLRGTWTQNTEALAQNARLAFPESSLLSLLIDSFSAQWGLRNLPDGMPPPHLLELAGLFRSHDDDLEPKTSYESVVRAQAALDIGAAVRESRAADTGRVARALSLVAPIRDANGDRVLIGMGFALPGAPHSGLGLSASKLVTVVRPTAGISYASVGFPGLVGVVAGVNAERIGVFLHPSATDSVAPDASRPPLPTILQRVLLEASTIEQALSILRGTSPLGAGAVLIVDGKTRRWAVLERGPRRASVHAGRSRRVVSGVFSSRKFTDDAQQARLTNGTGDRKRAQRAKELVALAQIRSVGDLVRAMRDRAAPGGSLIPPGHRAAVGDPLEVISAVLDPARLLLWVGEGPGPYGSFRAFDLRHHLLAEGDTRVESLDIAAATETQRADATQALLAEVDLVQARRAHAQGRGKRATEAVGRALVRVPRHPGALFLAAEIALSLGDRPRATLLFRRFLDSGPESAAAEDRARVYLKN